LEHTLGLPREIWRVLDKAHGIRNEADYGGRLQVTERLFKDLLAAAILLHQRVIELGPLPSKEEPTA
jgi:hypothetical protein